MVSFEMIQQELNIADNAVEQAMNESPKTTDKELDVYQQQIVDHVSDSIVRERHQTLAQLDELDSTRKHIESVIEGFSLDAVAESARQKIVRLHAEWHEILENAKSEEGAALRNYKYFVYKNQLKREASYPESKVLHWAFIIAAILIESIVNSFFFAGASDMGLLGGLFQALFISLSNIGSALLIGIYVLPYKNHVDSKKQTRAKIATGAYIVFAFLFNLATAHYRTLIETDPLTAKINAIPHLIHHPFDINFEAWNLLIIGMMFVIVALLKGYKSDDVYPGFGEIDRKFKNAANYRDKRIAAIKAINRIIDSSTSQAADLSKDAKRQIKHYKSSLLQSETVAADFAKFISSAENVCNKALWKYREANNSVRSTKPPSYFSQKHSFADQGITLDLKHERVSCGNLENRFLEIETGSKQHLSDKLSEINEQALADITAYFGKTK